MAESEKIREKRSQSSDRTAVGASAANVEHAGKRQRRSVIDPDINNLSAAFENPLSDIPKEQLLQDVETFCSKHNLMDYLDAFKKGALIAQRPYETDDISELTQEDRDILTREHTHRWHQPFTLYWLVVMCSLAAAVQGMDETVNNGAQALYLKQLGITDTNRFSSSVGTSLPYIYFMHCTKGTLVHSCHYIVLACNCTDRICTRCKTT